MKTAFILLLLALGGIASSSPAFAAGNPVEPLTNGLDLRWSKNDILQRFGKPKPHIPSCEMDFGDFAVHKCYGPASARVFLNSPQIALSSGIAVGSSQADVAGVFGNPHGVEFGPYRVQFKYNGDRVAQIVVNWDANVGTAPPGGGQGAAAGGGVAGTWICVAPSFSKGSLNLLPNGTYSMNGGPPAGHYRVGNGGIQFDGPLREWNNGIGRIENGTLIFEWKNREGWRQYFAYRKS